MACIYLFLLYELTFSLYFYSNATVHRVMIVVGYFSGLFTARGEQENFMAGSARLSSLVNSCQRMAA